MKLKHQCQCSTMSWWSVLDLAWLRAASSTCDACLVRSSCLLPPTPLCIKRERETRSKRPQSVFWSVFLARYRLWWHGQLSLQWLRLSESSFLSATNTSSAPCHSACLALGFSICEQQAIISFSRCRIDRMP